MTVSADWIEGVAKVTGSLLATEQRRARALREAGGGLYASALAPGGGKNAAHLEVAHLVNFVLALAGGQPSDAPAMVERLRSLRFIDFVRVPPAGVLFGLPAEDSEEVEGTAALRTWDLGTFLEKLLTVWAAATPEGRKTALAVQERRGLSLILNPAQRRASIREVTETGTTELLLYGVEPKAALRMAMVDRLMAPAIAIGREVTIPAAMLFLAADALADTPAKRGSDLPFPPSGSPASDTPEAENAAPARAASTDEQADSGLDTKPRHRKSDAAEGREGKEVSQPSFALSACSSPVTLPTGARANGPPDRRGLGPALPAFPERPDPARATAA